MNKYLWCECTTDEWPTIETVAAKSYNDAVERIISKYGVKLSDDKILSNIDTWEDLREYLNDEYLTALSDLEDIEEI